MLLNDLINSTHWFSVEMTILKLYPEIKNVIEEYKKVFEKIKLMYPEPCEMEIVLTECEDNYDEEMTTYVDVSGRKLNEVESQSYALEFTEWKKWLGMKIANETVEKFTELEIISHCLYEMTFVDYEEDEIQEQFNSIKKIASEYKNLTEEERKDKTISFEKLIKQLKEKGSS
ncbi:DUF6557 family protein [Mesonia sp. HuA40]|uniref:DUF6557 family protein n=1 Tax=Mesonia sp. HuA40 TaxID=2602761 RepID=UPI0011C9B861|nr:DUF6557 family protein [Mesonia sp. HuA40]TXK73345.1 hypothetical protein FT993_06055 [Mesonia sp. HuA40]